MTKTRDVEVLLHRTLHAKAAQLEPDVTSARNDSPLNAAVVDARPRRAGVRRALAIAAVIVVVALVVGVIASTQHDSSTRPVPTTIAPVDGSLGYVTPTGAMAPSYVPDGMQLWSMQTSPAPSGDMFTSSQLFGRLTADGAPDPGILVEMERVGDGDEIVPGAPNVLTIHGQRAPVEPSKDGGAAPTEIGWIEDGIWVRATIRGLEPAEAAAILDAARAQPSGLRNGLDPASMPGDMPLIADHHPTQAANPAGGTLLAYDAAPPTLGRSLAVTVSTTTASGYPGYLHNWIGGSGSSAGSMRYDPGVGFYVDRPDGTSIVVSSPTLGENQLRRIALSVAPVDASRWQTLRDELDQRITELPIAATADAGAGVTLELRGVATDPTTLCAVRGGDLVCAPPVAYGGAFAGSRIGTYGSVVLDGQWFVFAAATSPVTITARGEPQSGSPENPRSVAGLTTGQLGPWTFAAVVVAAGTSQVDLEAATSAYASSSITVFDPR